MPMDRVILTTGGTGGHIFPAMAVARELKDRFPDTRILFVGGDRGLESRICEQEGIEFVGLPVRGVLGKGLGAVSAMLRMGRSLIRALGLVGVFRPDIVAGFGGYASFCPLMAGWMRGAPCVLHEQNSVPGVANRIMARFSRKVFVSFPGSEGRFPKADTECTGNPVRKEIRALAESCAMPEQEPPTMRLLVLGGTQGAKAVNTKILDILPELVAAGVSIRHQTGKADLERVRRGYRDAYNGSSTVDMRVEDFIGDMAGAYAWADLVCCRSGASTVFELAVAGKPAILIPFPHATHDHQTMNARFLEQAGGGRLVREADFATTNLAGMIKELLDPARRVALRDMGRNAASLGRPRAAEAIVDGMERVAGLRPREM